MKSLLKGLLRRCGYQVSRVGLTDDGLGQIRDLSAEELAIVRRVRPCTMTGPERLAALIGAVNHLARRQLPGDIVECGVWRGGSMMTVALTLLLLGDTRRTLYLYDTFDGMSPPTDEDRSLDGVSAQALLARDAPRTGVWAYASLEDVRANLLSTGYPAERIRFIQGKVEDTIPGVMPDSIALLRLDTDWYQSTRHELAHLYPRLRPGGILIVDDYGHWRGSQRAVDEYFSPRHGAHYLHRVDYTARLLVKPEGAETEAGA